MTLREIFNSILDYPLKFNEFDPWGVAAGIAITVGVLLLVNLFYSRYDGDSGWHT